MSNTCFGCKQKFKNNAKIMVVRIVRWSGTEIKNFHYRCGLTITNLASQASDLTGVTIH